MCDNGFRLLATHAVDAGISEEGSSAMVKELNAFLENVKAIDRNQITQWSNAMPAGTSIAKRSRTICRKSEELERLISARIDGIQSLTQKHMELKDQLHAVGGEKNRMNFVLRSVHSFSTGVIHS